MTRTTKIDSFFGLALWVLGSRSLCVRDVIILAYLYSGLLSAKTHRKGRIWPRTIPDDLSQLICGTRLTTSFVPLLTPGSLCSRAPFWPIALVEGGTWVIHIRPSGLCLGPSMRGSLIGLPDFSGLVSSGAPFCAAFAKGPCMNTGGRYQKFLPCDHNKDGKNF